MAEDEQVDAGRERRDRDVVGFGFRERAHFETVGKERAAKSQLLAQQTGRDANGERRRTFRIEGSRNDVRVHHRGCRCSDRGKGHQVARAQLGFAAINER